MTPFLIAQALVEHGMLDSLAAGFARLRYEIDAYVGPGRSTYVFIGALVLFMLLISRSRR